MTDLEPEFITILEGPTPEFQSHVQLWNWGIYQGMQESDIGLCELRTNNGADIRARCRQAWDEGRKVQLDFPDELRMRQKVDVVSLRLDERDEGMVLKLWVYLPFDEDDLSQLDFDDDDEFGGDFFDDDDDDDGDGMAF